MAMLVMAMLREAAGNLHLRLHEMPSATTAGPLQFFATIHVFHILYTSTISGYRNPAAFIQHPGKVLQRKCRIPYPSICRKREKRFCLFRIYAIGSALCTPIPGSHHATQTVRFQDFVARLEHPIVTTSDALRRKVQFQLLHPVACLDCSQLSLWRKHCGIVRRFCTEQPGGHLLRFQNQDFDHSRRGSIP